MKRVLLVTALLITLLVPSLAYAQDGGELRCSEEDLQAGIQEALAGLQEAEGMTATEALNQVDQIAASLNLLSYQCRNVSAAQGTRSNPIPFGEYYEFEGGLIRITSIIDPYEPQKTAYSLEDGNRIIAVELEYVCRIDNPDESCDGEDLGLGASVTREGVVTGFSYTYSGENYFNDMEVFSGNTIKGNKYFQLPIGQEFSILRFHNGFSYDEIYFSAEASE